MRNILALLICAASFALSAPPPAQVTRFIVNGSGCPPGSFKSFSDGTNVFVELSQFVSTVGGDADPLSARKNCQATISLQVPAGIQFAPSATFFNASYSIQSQVTLTRTASYFFQGQLAQDTESSTATGPQTVGPTIGALTFSGDGPFSACGGTSIVSIDLSFALNNGPTNNNGVSKVTTAQFGNFVFSKC